MASLAESRKVILLLIYSLALVLQYTEAQVGQTGKVAARRSTAAVNVNLKTARPRIFPRNANLTTEGTLRHVTTVRPSGNQSAPNNKVSVQLSRVIQNQFEAEVEDRSFANPGSQQVEEYYSFDRSGNTTATARKSVNYPPPQKQHFKPGKLLALLDNEFDPVWLAIDKPYARIERPPAFSFAPDPDLSDKLAGLNFSIFALYDSAQALQLQPGLVSLFKTWLHRYATCQMEYFWEELDIQFWPRYIKRGTCINSQPCSWPPGMKCKPSRQKGLKLLRWMCQTVEVEESETPSRAVIRRNSPDEASQTSIRVRPSTQPRRGAKKEQKKRKAAGEGNDKRNPSGRGRKEKRNAAYFTDPETSYLHDGVFCQWKPTVYSVVEKCSCSCSP